MVSSDSLWYRIEQSCVYRESSKPFSGNFIAMIQASKVEGRGSAINMFQKSPNLLITDTYYLTLQALIM